MNRLLPLFFFCCTLHQATAQVGKKYPSEKKVFTDKVTGLPITALTTNGASDGKIYQTHPQWTLNNQYVVFTSNRTPDKRHHAFAVHVAGGTLVQLTDSMDGSINVARKRALGYLFRGNQLVELDLETIIREGRKKERVAATLPPTVKNPGNFCLDAFEQEAYFTARPDTASTVLYRADLKTGKVDTIIRVPFWANHLQTNPWVPGEILYCWETGGDAPQRMWAVNADGTNNRPVYAETPNEWVTHEVFAGPDHVLFNVMAHLPRLRKKPSGIFLYNLRRDEVKVLHQAPGTGYWHSDATPDLKWAVGDTFDGALYKIDIERGTVSLLTTGHRPNSNDPFTREPHSHHNISPDGTYVLFNSGMLGNSDLMLVPLNGNAQTKTAKK